MKDLKRALEQAGRGCARSGKALTAPIGSGVCRIAAAGDGVHLWSQAELPPDKAGHRELLGLLGCLNRGEAGAPVFTLVDGQTVEAEARCARSPEAVLGALSRVEEVLGLLQDCAAGRLDSAAEQTRLAEEQRTAA
ncbi:MAG: hypothetical protein IJ484_00770, partial [Oscillospiraceae bacterium]|nr:hypothetical protein [Oscillospiraceae bacterium]